jgi:hypothetical protein
MYSNITQQFIRFGSLEGYGEDDEFFGDLPRAHTTSVIGGTATMMNY